MSNHAKVNYSILLLRLGLGLLFLWAGLDKLLNNFSAVSYLLNVATGPFQPLFANLTNYAVLVNILVIGGELGIGLALTLGLLTRFAAVCGILMMALFYLSTLPQKGGPISQHIIYILVFALLFISNAGQFWGLDKYLQPLWKRVSSNGK
jgi:thiosulfate dehydrogenase [quinone] large subunit